MLDFSWNYLILKQLFNKIWKQYEYSFRLIFQIVQGLAIAIISGLPVELPLMCVIDKKNQKVPSAHHQEPKSRPWRPKFSDRFSLATGLSLLSQPVQLHFVQYLFDLQNIISNIRTEHSKAFNGNSWLPLIQYCATRNYNKLAGRFPK